MEVEAVAEVAELPDPALLLEEAMAVVLVVVAPLVAEVGAEFTAFELKRSFEASVGEGL